MNYRFAGMVKQAVTGLHRALSFLSVCPTVVSPSWHCAWHTVPPSLLSDAVVKSKGNLEGMCLFCLQLTVHHWANPGQELKTETEAETIEERCSLPDNLFSLLVDS